MTFTIDNEDIKKISKWVKQQKKKNNHNFTLGERWSYIFTPTGLGILISIKDNLLDEQYDITDILDF
jgi:hypothetical protein